jgi:nucleoid-associated protein YgaU
LIGRALYKRGGSTGEMEGEVADTSNNNNNAEKPVDALSMRPRAAIRLGEFENSSDIVGANTQATPLTTLPPLQPAPADMQRSDLDHESALRTADSAQPRDTAHGSETYFAYSVAAGDNPWKISSKVFGDGKYTQKIVEANGGMDALKLKLKTGNIVKIPQLQDKHMLLTLPAFSEGKAPKATHESAAADKPSHAAHDRAAAAVNVPIHGKIHSYKVEKGDTMTSIARKNYGNTSPKTIAMIAAANHGLDANALKAGQEIVLPQAK